MFRNYTERNEVKGDNQVQTSSSLYNYFPFIELLAEKNQQIAETIGEPVLPTYTYARVYKLGSVLEKHVDRDACEISVTLHLAGDQSWPIYINDTNGETHAVILNSGDAMVYLGKRGDHWRGHYTGNNYVQVFLHYVRSRGEYSFSYFDKHCDFESLDNDSYLDLKELNNDVIPSGDNTLAQYVSVFDNIVPHELCDRIIKEYGPTNEWESTQIGEGVQDKTIRNTDGIFMSLENVIKNNLSVRQQIDDELYGCAKKAIKKYNQVHPFCRIEKDSGYQLLRYNTGGYYIQHVDSYLKHPRSVSCSFKLNDDYEGGDLVLFDGTLRPEVKKGSVIMFPSNFMYPHEILPVTSGIRYSVITWFI